MIQHKLTEARAELEEENRKRLSDGRPQLQFFIPMGFRLVGKEEKVKRVRRPLMPGFVFVRASHDDLLQYKVSHPNLFFYVPSVLGVRKSCLVVPDNQMDYFIRVASAYDQEIPCLQIDEASLVKGDVIRVIGGPFSGVEGIFLASRGKSSGKVVVSIPGVMSISSWEIEPEYIQIVRFAEGSKRMYDIFDAFFPRAQKLIDKRISGELLSDSDLLFFSSFAKRVELLQTDTNIARAKLVRAMIICFRMLRQDDLLQSYLKIARDLLPLLGSNREKLKLADVVDANW